MKTANNNYTGLYATSILMQDLLGTYSNVKCLCASSLVFLCCKQANEHMVKREGEEECLLHALTNCSTECSHATWHFGFFQWHQIALPCAHLDRTFSLWSRHAHWNLSTKRRTSTGDDICTSCLPFALRCHSIVFKMDKVTLKSYTTIPAVVVLRD